MYYFPVILVTIPDNLVELWGGGDNKFSRSVLSTVGHHQYLGYRVRIALILTVIFVLHFIHRTCSVRATK